MLLVLLFWIFHNNKGSKTVSELFSPSSGGLSWEGLQEEVGRSQGREVTLEAQKGLEVGFASHAVEQLKKTVSLNCLFIKGCEAANAACLCTAAATAPVRHADPQLGFPPSSVLVAADMPSRCCGWVEVTEQFWAHPFDGGINAQRGYLPQIC